MEQAVNIDFSKARPQQERLSHPLVQIAVAAVNHFRPPGMAAVVPQDIGSTNANIALSMGIPAIAIGAATTNKVHTLEESADATTMVPGIKFFITLAVALTRRNQTSLVALLSASSGSSRDARQADWTTRIEQIGRWLGRLALVSDRMLPTDPV